MSCNTIPQSCLDPSKIFAGVYNPNCGGFGDPSNFQAEQAIFKSGMGELINNYGTNCEYYINGFNLSAMNILYGEHSTQEYSPPFTIKAYIELQESVSLTPYGVEAGDDLTAYISIDDYTNKFIHYIFTQSGELVTDSFGNNLITENNQYQFYKKNGQRMEPKSDDLIEISALGCGRPGTRGSKIFRITEVLDQDVSGNLNPLMTHSVWRIHAKRFEYNHSTNAPQELGNDQVYDNLFSGKLSSVLFPSLTGDPKVYPFDIDTISKNDIYDMEKNDTTLYGNYY